MIASFPIAPEAQPRFAILCAIVVFLVGALYLLLKFLRFRAATIEKEGAFSLKSLLHTYHQQALASLSSFELESSQFTASHSKSVDARSIGIVVLACVCIACISYFGHYRSVESLDSLFSLFGKEAEQMISYLFDSGPRSALYRLAYWAFTTCFFYFFVPYAFVKWVLRESPRDFGLDEKGIFHHSWIYLSLFLIVLPFVTAVSTTESFQSLYPFYHQAHHSLWDFLAWESIYAIQFFSLEFFYRGFLIHGLKKRFGFYTILLSVVPYCMIHFGKPMPEAIGAILAGLALGILSLTTNSIWLGVLIHLSVAVSMDFLSLAGQGKF